MPEIKITIGGRDFEVGCQEGEEHFLQAAAALLDGEASVLAEQIGRMPEARMLLMAGLMLADKTAGLEERLAQANDKLATQEQLLEELRARPTVPDQVAVIPQEIKDTLAEIAARAESVADTIEEKANA
ncbi:MULTISPECIES: cell division protein ZapA [Halocynthiibacter]|uniref:Cell division protein ZapA n=1 Tax=Halocynthiibacter halioticoli TaxID=2986804 RepID=A0AAE3IY48_9RHOB|nr:MULTISPECIES: cell division protein ZapA [Halocynthiibacter]MCV6824154.1 cell division protein ZapA [Halocynthiibacter halioticoli]MCW4057155.1 cell division protein ZapA [Halocynthiibacter sp. SDUM655004]MDE0589815.1 cell division protein ZapA [Halocynthiibacter sp. C4]